ncbi:3-phosphoserine/phosphohydroxythreonine transaminase [Butyricicoccus intestinisimiae]|uniref:Phosphoserine aminotransferase n=1 Tax=Butyricicoccus intestinisimiae TaxID=2841509 RepID=A0ABS6ESF2_9FIRM|nr:3-phosphoserine/phosphohydroxythreonine transaminase [Butyricicoccus intestinisimiae]MBU5490438.1 3-phosphoserine/phosphohydroxythreonine transaminase [Butyricicoccus intestinisimiae]
MSEGRIYNFSAGPSMMPLPVLEKAAAEMTNYGGSGMSVMEMSHRSKYYDDIINGAQDVLRRVYNIPDNYRILFMQGGATMQFSAVPLNLMVTGKADYAITGNFARNAYKEAKKFGDIHIAATSEADNFTWVPTPDQLDIRPDADYFYICANNTIFGTEWHYDPNAGDVPVVADMSSNILSKPVDISKYGMIYAGAQKNMGPAGMAVVIIREDLMGHYRENMPVLLDYQLMADKNSMYNTPPTYSIYMMKLVTEWVEQMGGLEAMAKNADLRSSMLYDYLDSTDFYKGAAQKASRSRMNVTFRTGNDELDKKFIQESIDAGMTNLKGHRLVGGMRASIYNAMPIEGVEYLIDFMKKFENNNK